MFPAFFDGMPGVRKAPIRVLLAEDEFLLRMDAADGMRRLGWDVVEVSSADEGLELLRHSVRFDLLVTDIEMPGQTDGLDLARYVRSEYRDMKIAIMSASGKGKTADPLLYDLFLAKPVWNVASTLAGLMEGARHAD